MKVTPTYKVLEGLAEVARLEEQTDDAEEAVDVMRVVNKLRTPSDFLVFDHPRTEQSEDLVRVVLEEFGVITPYTPEDEGWKTMPVQLVYDAGGGRQIELNCYNLVRHQVWALARAIGIGLQSESEFRRLLAELEAVVQADENQDD
jgi:hypothetical protein